MSGTQNAVIRAESVTRGMLFLLEAAPWPAKAAGCDGSGKSCSECDAGCHLSFGNDGQSGGVNSYLAETN